MSNKSLSSELKRVKRYFIAIATLWIIIVSSFFLWSYYLSLQQTKDIAKSTAQAYFNKDNEFGNWSTKYNGVYVSLKKEATLNLCREHSSNSDIVTELGDTLRFLNHICMIEQFQNKYKESHNIIGKIIRLNSNRLENVPDEWEQNALYKFENGIERVCEFTKIDGEEYFRIIEPIKIEDSCIKCHENEHFSNGVIRGGISISLPMKDFWINSRNERIRLISLFIFLIIFGFIGIKTVENRFTKRIKQNAETTRKLKEKDETLKLTLGATNAGIWDWNIQTKEAIFDERWAAITGHTIAELEPINIDTWNALVYPEDNIALEKELERLYKKEIDNYIFEIRMKHKNGFWVWVQIRGNIIEWTSTELPFRMVGIIIDISERKKWEHDLLKMQKKLKDENINKDKFFSIISHDLKSPFGTLLSIAQLLEENYNEMDNNERRELIHVARNSSKNIYRLLEGLLEWSQASTGRMVFSPSYLKLEEITDKVILIFAQNISNKNIELTTKISNNLIIYADEKMLRTVIRNLLANAIKFTPRGGQIIISSEIKNENIEIAISDNGIGIKKADINKLFRIDVHHTTVGTENESGTGVGLILCKELVEKNGGKIWVESELNKGSSFKFTFPLVPPSV